MECRRRALVAIRFRCRRYTAAFAVVVLPPTMFFVLIVVHASLSRVLEPAQCCMLSDLLPNWWELEQPRSTPRFFCKKTVIRSVGLTPMRTFSRRSTFLDSILRRRFPDDMRESGLKVRRSWYKIWYRLMVPGSTNPSGWPHAS